MATLSISSILYIVGYHLPLHVPQTRVFDCSHRQEIIADNEWQWTLAACASTITQGCRSSDTVSSTPMAATRFLAVRAGTGSHDCPCKAKASKEIKRIQKARHGKTLSEFSRLGILRDTLVSRRNIRCSFLLNILVNYHTPARSLRWWLHMRCALSVRLEVLLRQKPRTRWPKS